MNNLAHDQPPPYDAYQHDYHHVLDHATDITCKQKAPQVLFASESSTEDIQRTVVSTLISTMNSANAYPGTYLLGTKAILLNPIAVERPGAGMSD